MNIELFTWSSTHLFILFPIYSKSNEECENTFVFIILCDKLLRTPKDTLHKPTANTNNGNDTIPQNTERPVSTPSDLSSDTKNNSTENPIKKLKKPSIKFVNYYLYSNAVVNGRRNESL